MREAISHVDEGQLYTDISGLIDVTQQKTLHEINKTGVLLYWHIGRRINHDLLKFNRAEYGANLVKNLADRLHTQYGRGFGLRVIQRCSRFEKLFPDERIIFSLCSHLKWTHFVSLLNIDSKLKREFYAEMCRIERWSTRELSRKIEDMLFERTAIAKRPENIIEREIEKLRETDILEPDLIIQDPYIFAYLGADVANTEKTLEDAILNDIEEFLLNMGKGFTFQERQKVIEIDGDFFKIDLLMFHRKLRCMIAIELK